MSPAPTIEDVDARLQHAKRRVSLAALACLRGAPDAAEQVRKALDELEGARHALRFLQPAPVADEERE
jgi:hypothetical protein